MFLCGYFTSRGKVTYEGVADIGPQALDHNTFIALVARFRDAFSKKLNENYSMGVSPDILEIITDLDEVLGRAPDPIATIPHPKAVVVIKVWGGLGSSLCNLH